MKPLWEIKITGESSTVKKRSPVRASGRAELRTTGNNLPCLPAQDECTLRASVKTKAFVELVSRVPRSSGHEHDLVAIELPTLLNQGSQSRPREPLTSMRRLGHHVLDNRVRLRTPSQIQDAQAGGRQIPSMHPPPGVGHVSGGRRADFSVDCGLCRARAAAGTRWRRRVRARLLGTRPVGAIRALAHDRVASILARSP